MPTVRQATTTADFQQAQLLLRDYVDWMREAGGFDPFDAQPEFAHEIETLPAYYGQPGRTLFVARLGGDVVGTVAIRLHEDGSSELKRMYVRPTTRGSGIADELIGAALDHARANGSHCTWLESMRGVMERAIAVYRRNGFREVPAASFTLPVAGVIVMERRFEEARSVA